MNKSKFLKFSCIIVSIIPLQIIAKTLHPINDIKHKINENYQIYVEIPAATSEKWEVNKKTGVNELQIKNGKTRIVDFIPYIGNYGFFPQTLSEDNDPLDVIYINENIPKNSISEVFALTCFMASRYISK